MPSKPLLFASTLVPDKTIPELTVAAMPLPKLLLAVIVEVVSPESVDSRSETFETIRPSPVLFMALTVVPGIKATLEVTATATPSSSFSLLVIVPRKVALEVRDTMMPLSTLRRDVQSVRSAVEFSSIWIPSSALSWTVALLRVNAAPRRPIIPSGPFCTMSPVSTTPCAPLMVITPSAVGPGTAPPPSIVVLPCPSSVIRSVVTVTRSMQVPLMKIVVPGTA